MDYEQIARKAGWTIHQSRITGTAWFSHPEHGLQMCESWQELCEEFNLV